MDYVDSDGGLYQYRPSGYVYLYCGYSLIVCLPDTDNYRRLAFGNRYCRYGSRLRANVITKSGKAVETAGDIDTLLLDKTGTITIGNRKATKFHPAPGIDEKVFVELAYCPRFPMKPRKESPSSSWGVRTDIVCATSILREPHD